MIRKLLSFFLLAGAVYAQTPVITSIQNPASNILPGLPNFGIAQGQIFVLYGSNMGPTTIAQPTALPLTNTLGGTSVAIKAGGIVFNAPIIYSLNSQIAAVMPSLVTVGSATVTVTYNNVPSSAFNTQIVSSNFGISTANQTGTGPAVITTAAYALITPTSPAAPGSTYTMWGTGLGAANSDNNIATNGDLGTSIQVFVGGVAAAVTYRGRSAGPGLDQINFTIPAGVSGCRVSLMVVTNGTTVSNAPTIPVAPGGSSCSDANVFGGVVQAAGSALTSKGTFALGVVDLDGNKLQAQGYFLRFNAAQWTSFENIIGGISLGSCVTTVTTGPGSGLSIPDSTQLDAGAALTLTPPTGSNISMPSVLTGIYLANITSVASGAYKVTGPGGKDIGAFSASFNGPNPAFAWTNQNLISVTRSKGLTITWTGGDANSYVDITGGAVGVPVNEVPSNVSANFECQAPASAGTFTVPPSVLLSLPATVGTLAVDLNVNVQSMTVPNADASLILVNAASIQGQSVSFQ